MRNLPHFPWNFMPIPKTIISVSPELGVDFRKICHSVADLRCILKFYSVETTGIDIIKDEKGNMVLRFFRWAEYYNGPGFGGYYKQYYCRLWASKKVRNFILKNFKGDSTVKATSIM